MSRYFFHFRSPQGEELTDDHGDELPDAQAAEEHAIASAKQLMFGSSLDFRKAAFEVYENDRHVVTVWFAEAALRPLRTDNRSPPDDRHA